jgi:hypothetical protein
MADQRIKGQEAQLFMTSGSNTIASFDSIQDAEITVKLTKLEEGYLGETSDRYDDVFMGIDGTFTCHITTATIYDVLQSIIDRARRRVPGTVFNFKMTLQFPNGDRKRIVIPNIFFDSIPNSIPKRDQYVSLKLTFSAENAQFI